MRIAVIGGGPAGLYLAILMKRDFPASRITVVERNAADDTFGFGVVFSDATLDAFREADEPSYRAITQSFAYWDDIEIVAKGVSHRIGGNGFCGCSRRTLLLLLQERARGLGVELEFRRDAAPEDFPDADLVVAADGIASPIRERHRHFMVDREKLELTPDALFSHCLPVRRNVKVTDEVLDSPRAIHIDEAENRLHVQKALLHALLTGEL